MGNDEAELLVAKVVEGIQEKKGKNIVTVDLRALPSGICQFFVICEGNTPTQVSAISDSVWEYVRKETKEKPYIVDGERNAEWIAMDYGTVIVHIFLPERRAYYNLEHLWADAKLNRIPDLD
ncbi:MAG: ribosome silencing factor [Bacteroidales bacterium]|nr:ribosome silencing factor [Bacteroidales bacterium]